MKVLRKRKVLFATGVVASFVALAGVGTAALNTIQGTTTEFFTAVTENTAQTTSSTTFVPLPGASIPITIGGPLTRTINARFTAESLCTGAQGSYCSVRIVARNVTTGSVQELFPAAGMDFAFDSVALQNDAWEAHAIERSRVLPKGSYRIEVQWATTQAATTLRLDDWHFMMQSYGEPAVP